MAVLWRFLLAVNVTAVTLYVLTYPLDTLTIQNEAQDMLKYHNCEPAMPVTHFNYTRCSMLENNLSVLQGQGLTPRDISVFGVRSWINQNVIPRSFGDFIVTGILLGCAFREYTDS